MLCVLAARPDAFFTSFSFFPSFSLLCLPLFLSIFLACPLPASLFASPLSPLVSLFPPFLSCPLLFFGFLFVLFDPLVSRIQEAVDVAVKGTDEQAEKGRRQLLAHYRSAHAVEIVGPHSY